MSLKKEYIIVVDLEASCWSTKEEQGDMPNEIIEIGIAFLNTSTLQVEKSLDYFVKNELSNISNFCTELTGITQEKLNRAQTLKDVLADIRNNHKTHKYVWASYGEWDRTKIENVQNIHNIKAFSLNHINIKNMMGLHIGTEKDIGLKRAVPRLGLEWIGTHHNGMDDAINAANVMAQLIKKMRT